MKKQFGEIFDVEELKRVCLEFSELTGMSTAIIDLDGNIIVDAEWQEICTKFHRGNAITKQPCIKSDTKLAVQFKQGKKYNVYSCKNGLIDIAIPIIIEDEHIANFFIGQFLFEKPDIEFFRKQAQTYSFDEEEYLMALKNVPIFDENTVRKNISLLLQLIEILVKSGLKNLKIREKEEKAETSEQQLELIANNLIEGMIYQVAMLDENRRQFNYLSDGVFQLYGCSPEEAMNNPDLIYGKIHPDDIENLIVAEKKALKNMSTFKVEARVFNPDGSIRWSYYVSQPRIINNLVCWDGIEVDISDRKLMEIELKEAKGKAEENENEIRTQHEEINLHNERLESLLRISQFKTNSIQELLDYALHEAIELTNSKIGYIYFYNESTRQFSLNTWSKEVMKECAVQNPQTIYNLDDTGCWGEAVRQRKPIVINEYKKENPINKGTPEGHVKLNKFLTIPVILDNKIVAVAGVANKKTDYNSFDIRQLTLLMDNVWKISERISIIDELRKVNANKDRFINILAHDLRNPFNNLLGFSNMLIENFVEYDKSKIEEILGIINYTTHKTFNLLEDLLLWSKAQAGMLSFQPQKYMFIDIYNEVLELMQSIANKKNITIRYTEKERIEIFADNSMFKTILRNLISNAIKYSNTNGKINIYTEKDKDYVIITISDNGVGIEQENIPKLFEFSSQYTTQGTDGESGTGFGLTLCKDFVENHGGKIWVESEIGKGSNFIFTIPFKVE